MTSNEVKEIYEKTAEDYDRWVIPCKKCQYIMLIEALDLRGNEAGIDVGCGPGELTRTLGKRLDRGYVFGLDISNNMIELAKKRTETEGLRNVSYINADYSEMNYTDIFDVCVSSYLFHWLDDPIIFLKWVRNSLKENGKIGLISPSPEWYWEVQEAYRVVMDKYNLKTREIVGRRIYQLDDIENYFEKEGFSIQSINKFSFKENTSIETCLQRVNAKSDRQYFSDLSKKLKKEAVDSLMVELMKNTKKLVTTESGYIVIASRM